MNHIKQSRNFSPDDVQERFDNLGCGDDAPEDNEIIANIASIVDMRELHPITVAATAVDLIRADERRRIAEALLSDEAVEVAQEAWRQAGYAADLAEPGVATDDPVDAMICALVDHLGLEGEPQ